MEIKKRFHLSCVLDNDPLKRLDLIEGTLEEIDNFTTKYENSNQIRNFFKNEIDEYLLKNYHKNGTIVITYYDDSNNVRRIRVLYKEEIAKTDIKKMPRKIKKALSQENNIKITLEIINRFTPYIFGSNYDKNLIYNKKREIGLNEERDTKINKIFINDIIFNQLTNALTSNYHLGYFKIRLIDSYLHRIGIETTDNKLRVNVEKIKQEETYKLEKKSKIEDRNIKFKKEGNLYQEDDGQMNLFSEAMYDQSVRVRMKDLLIEEEYKREH